VPHYCSEIQFWRGRIGAGWTILVSRRGTGDAHLVAARHGGRAPISEAIHKCSHRSNGPFVKVNCAAIPAGLLESELFGHERGAFTGAMARGVGRFERANLGTLFLDEIGDFPLELQPKILRVVQERQFERLGSATTIQTDVRVICATHRKLVEMINEGEFRADLFYRLSVFPIELPPLRERPEDIRLLVHHSSGKRRVWSVVRMAPLHS
jgi:transcriptional regulator with GAF, ATPase, and Fis domain